MKFIEKHIRSTGNFGTYSVITDIILEPGDDSYPVRLVNNETDQIDEIIERKVPKNNLKPR
jgi:hypothetical protein